MGRQTVLHNLHL